MTCPSAFRQSLNFDFGDFRDKVCGFLVLKLIAL